MKWCIRGSRWLCGLALPLAFLLWSAMTPGQAPPSKKCHQRVKIDTWAESKELRYKDFNASHTVTPQSDGSVLVARKKEEDSWAIFRVWPAQGRALVTVGPAGKKEKRQGWVEFTWTIPPKIWCSDQDIKITINARSGGAPINDPNTLNAAMYFEDSGGAVHFQGDPNKTIVGMNPRDSDTGVWAGYSTYRQRYQAEASGSVTLRPVAVKYRGKGEKDEWYVHFVMNSGIENFGVFYHYELDDDPVPPRRCAEGFAREWNTDWGKLLIRLDGNQANGTYSNRSGKFGGGAFTGMLAGDVLEATWKDDKGEGTFRLVLSDNGCSFTGTHTVKQPPSQGTGPTGGETGQTQTAPSFPADPCMDATVRRCIDEWIKRALALRNQNDPQNAPYSLSPYGTWLSRSVIAAYPPDGWDTKYRLSRYCFIWINYGQENLAPVYQGKLPPLHDAVTDCFRRTGSSTSPPSTPGTVSSPGSMPGDGTDSPSGPETPVTAMTLLAEKRKVKAGDLVTVPVWLLQGADLASLNFTITYDPKVAVPEGDLIRGNLLGDSLFSANPKESGIIRLGVAGSAGMNGSGTVAYLPFRAVGPPGAFTALHLEVTTVVNSKQAKLPIATVDGALQIIGQEGPLKGDCNGDGVVDARDAQCALDMSTRLIPEDLNLDMNSDGKVDAVDATLILQQRALNLLK